MTLTVSWTSLRRYEECHQRHYRTIRKEVSQRPFKRSYVPGTIADRVMRAWLDSPDPRPGEMVKMVPDWVDRITNPARNDEAYEPFKWKGDPAEDRASITEFVVKVVSNLEPVLLRHVIPHDYAPEKSFRVIVGIPYLDDRLVGIKLIGGIDIVTRLRHPDMGFETGDFVNYDLKATTNDAYIAKTLGQGTFYDIAWHAYYGVRPKRFGFIAPALEQQLWWSDISDDDRRVMMERIIHMAHGMWRGDWDPKVDDTGCEWCEARHACPKFATHLVTDDLGQRRISFDESVRARAQAREVIGGVDGAATAAVEGSPDGAGA